MEAITIDISTSVVKAQIEVLCGTSCIDDILQIVDEYLNVLEKAKHVQKVIVRARQIGVLKWIMEERVWSDREYSICVKEAFIAEDYEMAEYLLSKGHEQSRFLNDDVFNICVSLNMTRAVNLLFLYGLITSSIVNTSLFSANNPEIAAIILNRISDPFNENIGGPSDEREIIEIDGTVLYKYAYSGNIELTELLLSYKEWPAHVLYATLKTSYYDRDYHMCCLLITYGAVPDEAFLYPPVYARDAEEEDLVKDLIHLISCLLQRR